MEIDPYELLVLWWRSEQQWSPVEGYPSECPSTRGWRTSRQYDDGNGAFETDARGQLIRHIGHVVASIDEPYRSALYLVARNRASGVSVWDSPRLPKDEMQRMAVISDAVEMFAERV